MRPRVRPWPSASARLPALSLCAARLCSLEPPRRGDTGAPRSRGAAPSPPAGDGGLRGIHVPSWLRAMGLAALCPASGTGFAGAGSARSAARKTGEELPKLAGGVPRPGETKRCVSPGVRSPSSLAGEGERAALPRQSYPTSEQLLLSPSLAVGLPRYQHHPSPVCDRKDFVLNFNGISSFHPSASGSYYHHHHHQSVCQDIKPCVM